MAVPYYHKETKGGGRVRDWKFNLNNLYGNLLLTVLVGRETGEK